MAYSRWSNSIWYTFWSTVSGTELQFKLPTKAKKNLQTFEICDIPSLRLTYGEIKSTDRNLLLEKVRAFYSISHPHKIFKKLEIRGTLMYDDIMTKPKNIQESDLEELSGYFDTFIDDIEEHFRWVNFFKCEWWYPLRNELRRKIRKTL